MKVLVRAAAGLFALLIVVVLLGAVAFLAINYKARPNELVLDRHDGAFDFQWAATDMGGQLEPRSAMLAPVKVAGLSKTFYMQFDLGAQSSVFYADAIAAIAEKAAGANAFYLDAQRQSVTGLEVLLGNTTLRFKNAEIRKMKSARPINWDEADVTLIGTLGSDFLDGHVLTIDYPRNHIRLARSVSDEVAALPYDTFDYDERRILLHGKFDGRPTRIWFDTGTSAFALLTDADTWKRLAKNTETARSFAVNSWGSNMYMTVADTDAKIILGRREILLRQITSVKGASFAQSLVGHMLGISGMTGNKLFLDKQLILDAPRKRYWVVLTEPAP